MHRKGIHITARMFSATLNHNEINHGLLYFKGFVYSGVNECAKYIFKENFCPKINCESSLYQIIVNNLDIKSYIKCDSHIADIIMDKFGHGVKISKKKNILSLELDQNPSIILRTILEEISNDESQYSGEVEIMSSIVRNGELINALDNYNFYIK